MIFQQWETQTGLVWLTETTQHPLLPCETLQRKSHKSLFFLSQRLTARHTDHRFVIQVFTELFLNYTEYWKTILYF